MQETRIFDQAKSDLESIGVPDATDAALNIFKSYADPNRHYHGLEHIKKMLDTAKSLTSLSDEQSLELRLLIMYHDVWYMVGQAYGENERRSADWALLDLEQIEEGDTPMIRRLQKLLRQGILATITHTLDDVDDEFHEVVELLLDIDLMGLCQPRHKFQEDTEKIWSEYREHLDGDRSIFDQGRSTWAKLMLGRDRIFHHHLFQSGDPRAKSNLASLVIN